MWVLVRTALQQFTFSEVKGKLSEFFFFLTENFQLLEEELSIYLNRLVFFMSPQKHML